MDALSYQDSGRSTLGSAYGASGGRFAGITAVCPASVTSIPDC